MSNDDTKTRPDHAALAPWEVNTVIDWFLYHMPMEQRRKLMNELPSTYNKLIGREIMSVENATLKQDKPEGDCLVCNVESETAH